ncbi:3-isopropylmalate dehydratase small subunit [Microbacterium lacticum]|uniref:3-isopropylmalate dehydratase small subunit n=1 Tax=Microbacterium lacticum TaxID=33885 RepID=A0A4Y3UP81_9MICO|nr:3-isopropylmalate dehydratase small subunit [Microbacterium lacticum]MBF9336018.1 3-isopropylmalate dehydratase small subunit [Microbacterium lacticum]TQN00216.1 3-isopropylmalate/(R)-2-methylmalate dehydratase small subunit [Microbacterium lacticum]GEB95288.1 3-isopropylmalate dehydratase small subunit [Microbacterium lacticum]GGN14187.1 3-isopropylmalate dehydratase small subunit [Microbacterium lacticum]
MEKFTTHTGVAAPLTRSAVDTDQIIPAVYLKRVTKTGFDDALFANWRQDPEFVLNQPAYAGASILVAGPDFGTGSSREHAVWALRDYGFQVVLSPKFADIFRGNAGKQGLVTGVISESDGEAIWAALAAQPGAQMTVDLETRTAQLGELRVSFDLDDYTRWRLLEGLDDIGLTLRNEEKIAQFEARREAWRPRTLPVR